MFSCWFTFFVSLHFLRTLFCVSQQCGSPSFYLVWQYTPYLFTMLYLATIFSHWRQYPLLGNTVLGLEPPFPFRPATLFFVTWRFALSGHRVPHSLNPFNYTPKVGEFAISFYWPVFLVASRRRWGQILFETSLWGWFRAGGRLRLQFYLSDHREERGLRDLSAALYYYFFNLSSGAIYLTIVPDVNRIEFSKVTGTKQNDILKYLIGTQVNYL